MRLKWGLSILIFLFITAIAEQSYADSRSIIHDLRFLNFDKADNAEYSRFEASAGFSQIEHWAKNRHLVPIADKEPYLDNRASFVSQYGSGIVLKNLNQNASYTLYIDFVSYRGGNAGIVSRLVISANGRKLASLNFGEAPEDRPYELSVPRELYAGGTLDIRFDEYATTPGVWGIWDCILSTGGLPAETVKPKRETPKIKEPSGKVAEPKEQKKKKTVTEAPKDKESKDSKDTLPPVKKKEPTIVEPAITREPEIQTPKLTEPTMPKGPSEPGQKGPDIRDQTTEKK